MSVQDGLEAVATTLEDGYEERPEACGIVIFGALGDLSRRKLLPSLMRLQAQGLLPERSYLLGVGREGDEAAAARFDGLLQEAARTAGVCGTTLDELRGRFHYAGGDLAAAGFFGDLARQLAELDRRHDIAARHLFYLALPPDLHAPVVEGLGAAGLAGEDDAGRAWNRVVVEKPFGRDLASARDLDRRLRTVLQEHQLFRIDHYLGKETVQNIVMFRFANRLFEPLWNHEHVDHVQITVAEALGIGTRADYYERAGCLRDIFQNHMLQMLALVAMEPPAVFEADRYRDEKVKVLRSMRELPADPAALENWVVRAQYAGGTLDGDPVPGYRDEPGVAPGSTTETYVAAKILVDNWRWSGVPFYLRSGKRLAQRASEIAVYFKPIRHSMFAPLSPGAAAMNVLVLNVQPEEGMSLTIDAKRPGTKNRLGSLTLHFDYRKVFGGDPPDAYERLLLDAMLGDQMLFVRSDDVAASWALVNGILHAWEEGDRCARCPLDHYPAGSWGPRSADALIEADGRRWRVPVAADGR